MCVSVCVCCIYILCQQDACVCVCIYIYYVSRSSAARRRVASPHTTIYVCLDTTVALKESAVSFNYSLYLLYR